MSGSMADSDIFYDRTDKKMCDLFVFFLDKLKYISLCADTLKKLYPIEFRVMQHYSTSFRGAEKMQNLSLLILIVVQCNAVISYKILGVFPTTSPSHYYVGRALMKGLAADGHDVTIISHFKEKNPFPNYNEVYLDGSYHEVLNGNLQLNIA